MCTAVVRNIPTGCKTIDEILEGGIPKQRISLVYGEAETGKTTLAMQCGINCARQGYKTLFVDCDGAFSTQRLCQIASKDFKSVAELIVLIKPNNFGEQAIVIDRLTDYVTQSFRLVVFDTLTSLYSVEIAEYPKRTFELNRELNRQMACLAQIAKTQKIAVLTTSQVRNVFSEAFVNIEPVATRVVKFWADIIIAMKPTENSQIIRAILDKSPRKALPSTYTLRIEETGIHECLIH